MAVATRFTHFKLVGPAIIAIALLIAGLAAIPYFGVAQLDAKIRNREETLVKRNISIWVSDVEFALTAWTIWDESIARIDNSFDAEWADRNIGASLIGTSRTRFAAILDPEDRIIYSKIADEVAERPFFARGSKSVVTGARALVDKVRAEEKAPKKAGIPDPIAFSKIEVLGSDAVLLTASLFQPDFKTSTPRGSRAPVLVSAVPIAGSLQAFLGDRFLLDAAAVGPLGSVAPDRSRVEIAVGEDGRTEVLSWRSPTPARDLLLQSLPLVATVAVVLVIGGAAAVWSSRRTVASLLDAERQMRHAATHDFLTGLANRSLIDTEFARLSGSGRLSVVCLDLDGFKLVNDRHGHAAGDELLREVSRRLETGSREGDLVFRLGGDEFAILMPSVSEKEAVRSCRTLSSSLSAPYSLACGQVTIGASFGLADVAENNAESCASALRRADEALYAAKRKGRGNIFVLPQHPTIQAVRSFG
jgi:diguanylate cyclase (GGDEF)-like protein